MARLMKAYKRCSYFLTALVSITALMKLYWQFFGQNGGETINRNTSTALSNNYVTTTLAIDTGNKTRPTLTRLTRSTSRPTLVLFTTFDESSLKPYHIYAHRLAIKNWAHFIPHIHPILFVNNASSSLTRLARKAHWDIIQLTSLNEYGTPRLRPMVQQIFDTYNCTFYGFANGDIIFGDSLLNTLRGIQRNLESLKNNVLMIGRRRNTVLNMADPDDVYNISNYHRLFAKSAKYRSDALDYLIFTRDGSKLKWNTLADVVIGRKGYDNYLVSKALAMGVNVIDTTRTLQAIHLTPPNGTHEKRINIDRRYNVKLIGLHFNYNTGMSYSAKLFTQHLHSGEVRVYRRDSGNKIKTLESLV